jgi:amino-acid N-acetyltransferase
VARDAGRSIGCAALEPYGTNALLRSLTVAESHRGRGIGQQLTEAALELAREHRIQKLYLLTTTAADFFATRFDFHPIARADVPAAVRESVEFVGACPDSAQVMFRRTD